MGREHSIYVDDIHAVGLETLFINQNSPLFLSRKGSDEALYINAITTILFWEGIPALYYGGELGLK
eukprot:1387316-Amorphochlora_amoeboformis.AAC.1